MEQEELFAFYIWRITNLGLYLDPVIEYYECMYDCVDDFTVGFLPAPEFGTSHERDQIEIPDGHKEPDMPNLWDEHRNIIKCPCDECKKGERENEI